VGSFLYKLFNNMLRASTKVSFIFFSAIAATIGGGLITAFYEPARVPEEAYEESRVPASSRPDFAEPAGKRVDPASRGGRDSSSQAYSGMPANYEDRANAQSQGNAEPISVTSATPDQVANGAAKRALAELSNTQALASETATSTSTGTSTSTSTSTGTNYPNVGGSSTSTSTSTSTTSTSPVYQYLTADGTGIPGLCIPVTLSFYDSTYVAAAPGADTPVFVTTTAGALYSDRACSAGTTSVTVPAGSTSAVFYFLGTAAGTASISAQHTSFNSTSVSITLSVPSASLVLGQASFTANSPNAGGAAAANTLRQPYHTVRTGTYLFAADTVNHRVLGWSTVPTSSQESADFVLGQPDLATATANTGGISASTMNYPSYVHSDDTRLFVADRLNNRVLIWSTLPTSRTAADIVLGQADMDDSAANQGGAASLSTLRHPDCVFSDGTRLLVCDTGNHRVLIWNSIPTSSNQAADVVVGQANGTDVTANAGGAVNGAGFEEPTRAIFSGSKLLVSDTNNRVLIWNSIPTSHGATASVVLGQSTFTDNTANFGGLGPSSLSSPGGLAVDSQGRLTVADFSNHRLLVWNSIPGTDFKAADSVIGQPTFYVNTANQGAIGASTLNGPWGLDISGTELWVSDSENSRILQHTLP
jgi:hypothetical protein